MEEEIAGSTAAVNWRQREIEMGSVVQWLPVRELSKIWFILSYFAPHTRVVVSSSDGSHKRREPRINSAPIRIYVLMIVLFRTQNKLIHDMSSHNFIEGSVNLGLNQDIYSNRLTMLT